MDLRVLTLPFDLARARFRDDELRELTDRQTTTLISHRFLDVGGRPYLTLLLDVASPSAPLPAQVEPPKERSAPTAQQISEGLEDSDRSLFNRLRGWRQEQAEERGVPSYVVLSNRELLQVVLQKPNTKAGLRKIPGLGKQKVERYGEALLRALRDPDDARELAS